MALILSPNVDGKRRDISPQNAAEGAPQRFYHTLTTAQNVTANIIDMGVLPAGCSIAELVLDCDALAASAMTMDVGIMTGLPGEALNPDGTARTMDAVIFAAAILGVLGGVARPTLKTAYRIAPSGVHRSIGVKVLLQGATPAEGEIGITVTYRQ